jgi:hypothetical protein
MDDMSIFMDFAQTFGTWAIFLYLFVQERKAHDETRREYRNDLRAVVGLRTQVSVNPPGEELDS